MPQIQLGDFTMQYVDHGTGSEPIVLLGGFISSARWWRPVLDRLPDRFHAYALNLRAWGEGDVIETGHTIAEYAADLHAFVEATGLDRFVLVAHSLGGGVAMQYAVDHQDRLAALVLLDPLAPHGTRLDPAVTAWVNAQQGSAEGIRGIILGGCVTPPPEPLVEELVEDGLRWGRPGYLGMMDDMARFNITERLTQLTVPTLVTWGDRDTVIPFEGIVATFTAIPGCGLEVWHNVGHNGLLEQPDRTAALLTQFVDEASLART
jgi:pimeloyl-ACP methyl ester carboxylesterase